MKAICDATAGLSGRVRSFLAARSGVFVIEDVFRGMGVVPAADVAVVRMRLRWCLNDMAARGVLRVVERQVITGQKKKGGTRWCNVYQKASEVLAHGVEVRKPIAVKAMDLGVMGPVEVRYRGFRESLNIQAPQIELTEQARRDEEV